MFDLLSIARTEADGGDLFSVLNGLFETADVKPEGFDDAVVWKGGNFVGNVNPVAHSFTDAYALLGTLAAIDVLKLPFYAVPMWSQYRHDTELAPLSWFGNMPCTSIKWSTAGDAYVNDGKGGKVVVMGKSANAPLRTQAGVYCNVRPYGPITVVRCMPCLPYSQNKKVFNVDDMGIVHSEMNTPGVQLAYANRLFLKMVHETGRLGRVATKPTQAMEDGINAGLHSWLLQGTKFEVGRKYAVDPYEEHKDRIEKIVALLPSDFKDGMENWGGRIEQHIADTNYGLLLWDLIEKRDTIVLATDLDGDRLTDLLADVSDPLRTFGGMVAKHLGREVDIREMWSEMGYTTGNGRDMTSVMYRMDGPPIHEQTLGSADAMLLRLLDGDESMGGTKQPYDPRIHFVLIRDAYLDANPENVDLRKWLDDALEKFDAVYSGNRPGFIEGYAALKEAIKPWGNTV
ncbi:MAG: hypothetical protein CFH41_02188 [Alphaproteobacteria bacterium MarineAlpha11_Bin1]|nr:MAG: hypothetical protein CFH41_02188 [Alphaproteobacteria bacterium MarineAlpha11_Bin1]|tara:strand:+ start:6769 stop:8142 length:1374 start_codon:yes stop_codon:yes gene_type:complete